MLNLRSLACVGLFHTRAARRLQIGPSLDLTQTRVSQRYHCKDTALSIKIEPSGGGRNLKLPRWLIYITQTRIGRIRGEERRVEIEKGAGSEGPLLPSPRRKLSRDLSPLQPRTLASREGSLTKAETPSYKLIEQQHGSPAEERGPRKPSPSIALMQRRDRLHGNESAHIADDGWEARPFRGGQDCTLKPVTTHQELRSQAN